VLIIALFFFIRHRLRRCHRAVTQLAQTMQLLLEHMVVRLGLGVATDHQRHLRADAHAHLRGRLCLA
jgi:hypothetical protein